MRVAADDERLLAQLGISSSSTAAKNASRSRCAKIVTSAKLLLPRDRDSGAPAACDRAARAVPGVVRARHGTRGARDDARRRLGERQAPRVEAAPAAGASRSRRRFRVGDDDGSRDDDRAQRRSDRRRTSTTSSVFRPGRVPACVDRRGRTSRSRARSGRLARGIRRHRGRLRPEPHRWRGCGVERTRDVSCGVDPEARRRHDRPRPSTRASRLRARASTTSSRRCSTRSDNASANALEVWLAGSTSAGSHRDQRADALDRSSSTPRCTAGYELRTLVVERSRSGPTSSRRTGTGSTRRRGTSSCAAARGLARVGRPRAAAHAADGVHGSRRPVPPLAPRARARRPEARPRTHG